MAAPPTSGAGGNGDADGRVGRVFSEKELQALEFLSDMYREAFVERERREKYAKSLSWGGRRVRSVPRDSPPPPSQLVPEPEAERRRGEARGMESGEEELPASGGRGVGNGGGGGAAAALRPTVTVAEVKQALQVQLLLPQHDQTTSGGPTSPAVSYPAEEHHHCNTTQADTVPLKRSFDLNVLPDDMEPTGWETDLSKTPEDPCRGVTTWPTVASAPGPAPASHHVATADASSSGLMPTSCHGIMAWPAPAPAPAPSVSTNGATPKSCNGGAQVPTPSASTSTRTPKSLQSVKALQAVASATTQTALPREQEVDAEPRPLKRGPEQKRKRKRPRDLKLSRLLKKLCHGCLPTD